MKKIIKRVFAIKGLSELGKSSVGRYLDLKGIRRLKIVDFKIEVTPVIIDNNPSIGYEKNKWSGILKLPIML